MFNSVKSYVWIIIVLGIVLYLRQYLFNRALWLDEAMLSLDIIKLPISAFLHQPMENTQAAPFGFLVVEKVLISFYGTTEYALRLFPLFSSIITLWLFWKTARIYLKDLFVVLAVFAFTFSPALIYYASEVKPYSVDVLMTLLSYVFIAPPLLNELEWHQTTILGLVGAVMIWFSFPVLFVLSGIAITIGGVAIIQKDNSKILKLACIFCCWFISFIFCFIFLMVNIVRVQGHFSFWDRGYISFTDPKSWLTISINILHHPLGFAQYAWLAGLLSFLGAYSFFKEDKIKFFFISIPLLFVFLASGLHVYSCFPRLVLFLVPVFLLLVINGVQSISLKTGKCKLITAIVLVSVLFYGSFFSVYQTFISPNNNEDVRTVLSYLQENKKEGDMYYYYEGAGPALKYYSPLFYFPYNKLLGHCIHCWKDQESMIKDLYKMPHARRVWLIFTGVQYHNNEKDDGYCIKYLLGSGGRLLDKCKSINAVCYLVDLSKFSNTLLPIKLNK